MGFFIRNFHTFEFETLLSPYRASSQEPGSKVSLRSLSTEHWIQSRVTPSHQDAASRPRINPYLLCIYFLFFHNVS